MIWPEEAEDQQQISVVQHCIQMKRERENLFLIFTKEELFLRKNYQNQFPECLEKPIFKKHFFVTFFVILFCVCCFYKKILK